MTKAVRSPFKALGFSAFDSPIPDPYELLFYALCFSFFSFEAGELLFNFVNFGEFPHLEGLIFKANSRNIEGQMVLILGNLRSKSKIVLEMGELTC